jgi:hypothetical protein
MIGSDRPSDPTPEEPTMPSKLASKMTKNVSIRFTPERHLLVRTLAARDDKSINEFVQGLVDAEIGRRADEVREEAERTMQAIAAITGVAAPARSSVPATVTRERAKRIQQFSTP